MSGYRSLIHFRLRSWMYLHGMCKRKATKAKFMLIVRAVRPIRYIFVGLNGFKTF